jgi:transcription elongation GreA/GreB family factor
MAAGDFDLTGQLARQLRDAHDAQAPETSIERRIREAQAKHPRARVHWDGEVQDVVVDLSRGGR